MGSNLTAGYQALGGVENYLSVNHEQTPHLEVGHLLAILISRRYEPPGFVYVSCLPVAVMVPLPVAMMIVMAVPVVAADTDANRAHMDADHRGIGSASHQAKRNNRSK
jgi:hypothetical protein